MIIDDQDQMEESYKRLKELERWITSVPFLSKILEINDETNQFK